jgi:hypothetical protein
VSVTADAQPVVARLDVVPVVLTLTPADGPSRTIGKARVIVTADRVYVYVDSSSGPAEAYSGRIDSIDGRNTTGWQVVAASGDVLFFRRGGGCLCGSQLKSFRPFPQGLVQGPYNLG